MDAEDQRAVLDRAETLLPKYGGFVTGAVNQACLLLGVNPTVDEFKTLEARLKALAEA